MGNVDYRVLVWQLVYHSGRAVCCRFEWFVNSAETAVYSIFDKDAGRWEVMGTRSAEALNEQLRRLRRGSDERRAYVYKGYCRAGRDFELVSYVERVEGFLHKSWIVPYALQSAREFQK